MPAVAATSVSPQLGPRPGPALASRRAALADVPQSQSDWRAFYETHWRWIYQLARRMGGSDIDVEDAVQDVFVVLAGKLDSFEGRSQLRTWIYRICLNVTSEHRRR